VKAAACGAVAGASGAGVNGDGVGDSRNGKTAAVDTGKVAEQGGHGATAAAAEADGDR
jgi:hypothetical protein